MALNKAALIADLSSKILEGNETPEQVVLVTKFIEDIADSIDTYIKSGDIALPADPHGPATLKMI